MERPLHRLSDFPKAVREEILRFRDRYGQTSRQLGGNGSRATGGDAQHVEPHDEGWAVRKEASTRATRVLATKREAVDAAREIAKNQGTQLVVHRKDGSVQERYDYS